MPLRGLDGNASAGTWEIGPGPFDRRGGLQYPAGTFPTHFHAISDKGNAQLCGRGRRFDIDAAERETEGDISAADVVVMNLHREDIVACDKAWQRSNRNSEVVHAICIAAARKS